MLTASSSPEHVVPPLARRIHAGLDLAPGEAILWQGRPSWFGTARHILHGDLILAYFALLVAIGLGRAALGWTTLASVAGVLPPALLVGGIVAVLSRAMARSTRYIVTPRRIVLRYGVAMPRGLSLPLSQVASLSVAVQRNGRGDVVLRMRDAGPRRCLKMWPHVRPFQLSSPQPMLRDIADAGLIATRLARMLVQAEAARDPVVDAPSRRRERHCG